MCVFLPGAACKLAMGNGLDRSRDPPSGQKIVSSTVSGVPGIDANLAACDTASSVTAAKLHPSISCEPHVVHILILGMLHL